MQDKGIEKKKWGRLAAAILVLGLIFLIVCCIVQKIYIFSFGLNPQDEDILEKIDGYYVKVHTAGVCGLKAADGTDNMVSGYIDDITEYDWKHEELQKIEPYRRTLCFSKLTEAESYELTDESGTVRYGFMYVLRGPKGNIHYYYRRAFLLDSLSPDVLIQENIRFSYSGTEYALRNYYGFSSDTDFTTNENLLLIQGLPCYFTRWQPDLDYKKAAANTGCIRRTLVGM